jgi:formyl-CoA transferase
VGLDAGALALSGILAALLERAETRRGCYVERSLLDAAMGLMIYPAQNYWLTGTAPQRTGIARPSLAPYQAFDAADGNLMIGLGNDAEWRSLSALLGLEDLAEDPRFATNGARVANFTEMVCLVQERIALQPMAHWLDALSAAGMPCAAIPTLDRALAHSQLASRQLVLETDHPVLGPMPPMGLPVAINGAPREGQRPPPLHGQHTAEILRALGYGDEAIAALTVQGVIHTPSDAEAPT